jgi:subtilisin family serine protease
VNKGIGRAVAISGLLLIVAFAVGWGITRGSSNKDDVVSSEHEKQVSLLSDPQPLTKTAGVDQAARRVFQTPPLENKSRPTPAFAISLQNAILDTSVSSPDGFSTKDRSVRARTTAATNRQEPTRRQTRPYLVQFHGPVEQSWKDEVESAGGILRGYVPNNAFLVELNEGSLESVASLPEVQWIGEYKPGYKVEAFLSRLVETEPDDHWVSVSVQTLASEDAEAVAQKMKSLGALLVGVAEGKRSGMVRAEMPLGEIMKLAELGAVQWIEEYVRPVLLNDFSVRSDHMNVTNVWTAHGLTGAGQVIGHADTGLDIGNTNGIHPDFTGRIRAAFALGRPGNWNDTHSHGTHTAGSILGDGTASTGQFRGVAYEAELVHQSVMDPYGGLGGLPGDLNVLFYQTYTNGARIHSDSWGSYSPGQYTIDSFQCDEFMWDHPDMLLVFSAGNDGVDNNEDGIVDPDSIGSPATAKNLMTVGATENDRAPGSGGYSSVRYGEAWPNDYPVNPLRDDYISQSADGIHQGSCSFSSRGPTDDGRIKPDIVAPGTDVISCRSRATGNVGWGVYTDNTNYLFMGGTSMATPLAAGAAALARQFCQERAGVTNPSAALIKALLVNGARSLTPGQHGPGPYREIPPLPRPNHVEGWGQVNLEDSLFPANASVVAIDSSVSLMTGVTNEHVFYVNGTNAITITMAYSDYPATLGGGVKLVNDLDMVFITPDGAVYHPNGRGSPDRTNNVEGLDFNAPTSGFYCVRVSGYNVPQGPQPYALVLRGNVARVPNIVHTPLSNTHITNAPYLVEAQVWSDLPFDTDTIRVLWNTTGSTNDFNATPMSWVSNHTYRCFIPAQSYLTDVYYYIYAGNDGAVNVHPTGAPGLLHHFKIARPVDLTVNGSPSALFTVLPDYGTYAPAAGSEIQAWATPSMPVSAGKRIACVGWVGAGSVPAWGVTNEFSFVISEPSVLEWQWQIQYALYQTSSIPGGVNATAWFSLLSYAQTLTAPDSIQSSGTNYFFANWILDGWRQPDSSNTAVNPVQNIYMYSAHSAVARYYAEFEDSNEDGMGDWWEYRYFGSLSVTSNQDWDGDGFINYDEYKDWTNPKDAGSFPHAPVIQHNALSLTQTTPAPWGVSAVITDQCRVALATLFWRRNAEPWQEAPLLLNTNTGAYQQSIVPPGVDGDLFSYRLEASDPLGLTSTNGPHSFEVHYPVMLLLPLQLGPFYVPAATVTNAQLTAYNDGSGPLNWRMEMADVGFFEDVENGTNGWTHSGQNDRWTICTGRWSSAMHAWYCGTPAFREYANNMDASLDTPPVRLGINARLTFNQWANMEYDTDQNDGHFWDGAIVEMSTDGGLTFETITPIGGYPYRITDNPASPFAPDTPCLAGTGEWSTVEFDLSAFAGQEVMIRFRFGSDGYVVSEGWYLDDILISPVSGSNDWVNLPVTNGMVAPTSSSEEEVELDTTPLALAETRQAVLLFYHDDPLIGSPFGVPVILHNNTRSVAISWAGHGSVMPTGTIYVLSGEATNFLISADEYYHVSSILTNGYTLAGFSPCTFTNFLWESIVSNSTLAVLFAANASTNGTPEWWLVQYGLTNGTPDQESAADQDADGLLTWQEYLTSTVPTNAGSKALVISDVESQSDVPDFVVVRWLSFTNLAFTYDVYLSTNLQAGFEPCATNLAATPPINVFTAGVDGVSHRSYYIRMTEP